MTNTTIEETLEFQPRFDKDGLIPCIVTSADNNIVLMMAYMNAEALERTIETREAHYWSRSRNELWHKGATSGATQKVISIKTDCDQDCLLITVSVSGNEENTCHTGRKTCFYRSIDFNSKSKLLKI